MIFNTEYKSYTQSRWVSLSSSSSSVKWIKIEEKSESKDTEESKSEENNEDLTK